MVVPYKLYGKTELDFIRRQIISSSEKWLVDWMDGHVLAQTLSVDVLDGRTIPYQLEGQSVFICENDSQEIICGIDSRSLGGLLSAILKLDVKAGMVGVSNVAKSIIEDVFIDYVNKVFFRLDGQVQNTSFAPGLSGEHESSVGVPGSLSVSVQMDEIKINFMIPCSVATNIAKHLSSEKPKRQWADLSSPVSPDQCTINGRTRVILQAGGAELDYGAVENITVGDVIRLDSRIDDPLTISNEDNQYVCQAYLGKRSNRKAAKIILNK